MGKGKTMWPIRPDTDKSRGGFQNRDVGRSDFGTDFGPDYGIDYARFSDQPDPAADLRLHVLIEEKMKDHPEVNFKVRNGFVIMKGEIQSEVVKTEIYKKILSVTGVKEVINQLRILT